VAAGDQLHRLAVLVETVEDGEEALAGDAERELRAVDRELVDEDPPAFAPDAHNCFTR